MSIKGQIVIPKEAREIFNIKEGDTSRGIAIAKYDDYLKFAEAIFNAGAQGNDDRD